MHVHLKLALDYSHSSSHEARQTQPSATQLKRELARNGTGVWRWQLHGIKGEWISCLRMEECNTKIQLISYEKIPLDFWGAEQKPLVSRQAGRRATEREVIRSRSTTQPNCSLTAELKFNSIKGTHGTERVLSQKHLWMQSREQILEKKNLSSNMDVIVRGSESVENLKQHNLIQESSFSIVVFCIYALLK